MKTTKMKVTIKKEITKVIEVSLPAYRKGSCHYFKIFSETRCIKVCDLETWQEISERQASIALNETEESSEGEFTQKFDEVLAVLKGSIVDEPELEPEEKDPDDMDEDKYIDYISDLTNQAHERSEGMER